MVPFGSIAVSAEAGFAWRRRPRSSIEMADICCWDCCFHPTPHLVIHTILQPAIVCKGTALDDYFF
jgi:hypothetical protein